MTGKKYLGRCLCGSIAFEVAGTPQHIFVCHCKQCRRWGGGPGWASANFPITKLKFLKGENALKWRPSSDYARRGFCSECGSSLFWHADKLDAYKDQISVAIGALDEPTGLKVAKHIFCADKGDYYDIGDGLPQIEKY